MEGPPASAPTGPKIWRAGTLTYTAAGLFSLFFWLLLGDFVLLLKDRSVLPVVQLLLKKFEASDMLAALLIGSLPYVIALVVVPVISVRSDNHRGRWGRRIPFLLLMTPIAVLSMVGLAYSPALGQLAHAAMGGISPGLNPTILACFGFFWVTFEFASIVLANALFGALVNDVVPQALLGRFYGLFRVVSLCAGMIFNYWLLGKAETHYTLMFVGIGTLYGVGFVLMCYKVKEGDYPPPSVPTGRPAPAFLASTRQYFTECFTNPYYLWAFAAIGLANIAFVPFTLFGVFFAKSVQMDMDAYGKIFALTYGVSLFLSYFIGVLVDRFHPLRVALLVLGLYLVASLWGGLFATDRSTFTIALIAHNVLSGFWWTATASLQLRLFPQAKFAQFASAAGIIGCLLNIVVPPLVGHGIDLSGHVYRYTFLIGSGLTLVALILTLLLYRRFVKLGGPHHYVAPA